MAVINGGSFAKDLLPFVGKWFDQEGKDLDPIYPKIFKVEKVEGRIIDEPTSAYFGLPVRKAEGAAVTYDSATQRYNKRYTVVDYALGFIITRNMLDDGMALVTGERMARNLRRSMHKGKDQVCAQVLNRAFNSSFTGGDGKELCATDHPTLSADLANEPTAAADLTEAALEQGCIDVGNMKDERGLRLNIKPRKLVIPLDLKFEAHRLLATTGRVGVADNDTNAIKDMGILPEPTVVNPYLTDDDAWFMLTDAPDGLKLKDRREIDLTTDNDFDTENAKFKSVMRFDVGWSDPRGVYGSPGA